MNRYPVSWRDETGILRSGRLELGSHGLQLESGSHRSGRISVLKVLYRDLLKAEMALSAARVGGRPTVALTTTNGILAIAPTGAALAREILGLLQASSVA
jgi:hypothetical protein